MVPQDSPEERKQKWFGLGWDDSTYESRSFVDFIKKYDPWYPEEFKRRMNPNKAISADAKKPRG
jgi:hypothetical protein